MSCEMAYLKSKWFFDFQKSRAFKKANEINGFVKFDISILVNSYGMPVENCLLIRSYELTRNAAQMYTR
jgi:hypothetical protein